MSREQPFPQIALDGVVFQYLKNTGIPRLWRSLLHTWAEQGFSEHLLVIDRDNTAPRLPGLRYCPMPTYDYGCTGSDAEQLQHICDVEGIDLFISTYYTTPISTPSVFMAYDMIPEVTGTDLQQSIWREKHYAILHALQYICISQSTARDLVQFFPYISEAKIAIAPCGIDPIFAPANHSDIAVFRATYGLNQPYFLIVGERLGVDGYKNVPFFFRVLAQWAGRAHITVVCVGGRPNLEPELVSLADDVPVQCLNLSDEDLRVAYSGAIALVYPSRYEGFGLPIAEAMACGCPVITSPISSIPEVGGNAVLYVELDSVAELVNALSVVQQPDVRQALIEKGLNQAKRFTWKRSAEIVAHTLRQTAETLHESTSVSLHESTSVSLDQPASETVNQPTDTEPKKLVPPPSVHAAFWNYFRTLQREYQPLQVTLTRTERQLVKAERQLKRSQIQVQQTQQQLEAAKSQIQSMESSKFWRIRNAFVGLKQKLKPNSTP